MLKGWKFLVIDSFISDYPLIKITIFVAGELIDVVQLHALEWYAYETSKLESLKPNP